MKLIIIGSATDVHLKYNSPYVSGYHAELLLLDNGDILLTDKGSRNGTFLNDIRVFPNKEITVKRGDNIRFADVALDWNSIPVQQFTYSSRYPFSNSSDTRSLHGANLILFS